MERQKRQGKGEWRPSYIAKKSTQSATTTARITAIAIAIAITSYLYEDLFECDESHTNAIDAERICSTCA
jgi:hypothetical protein